MQRRTVLAGAAACGLAGLARRGQAATEAAVLRRLRFTLTFGNPLSRDLRDQSFWCYLPASLAGQQQLLRAEVSATHEVADDAVGHRILHLSFEHFPAYAQKVVSLTTETLLQPASPVQALAIPAAWLAPERYIESDDPGIRTLASTLRQGGAVETARAIYEWVDAHLAYAGYIAEDLGAVYALTRRTGDCTEYADLVVALARASGIPARMIGGYVVDHDSAPRPEEYHNWAELHLDGRWRIVDAQKKAWLEGEGRYVAFRIYRDRATNAVASANRYRMQGELTVSY